MNKRQRKKEWKKVCWPFVDDTNLLTLDKEESAQALKDFKDYVWWNRRYKHYKDMAKMMNRPCFYQFPVGRAFKKYFEEINRRTRIYPLKTTEVLQSIDDLKRLYSSDAVEKEICGEEDALSTRLNGIFDIQYILGAGMYLCPICKSGIISCSLEDTINEIKIKTCEKCGNLVKIL